MGSVFLLLIVSISLAFGAWCIFIWAVRSGQFDDIEGIKYRMLDAEMEESESKFHSKKNLCNQILWNKKDINTKAQT